MSTIKRVEQALKYHPDLRDSDKALMLHHWANEGLHLSAAQEKIFLANCTTPETISRARRALREEYPGSEKVEEKRFNKFQAYKNNKAVSWL